jgi:hypothetical protein
LDDRQPVTIEGGSTTVVAVRESLDRTTGDQLVRSVEHAVHEGAERVEVDLLAVTTYTEQGAESLRSCRDAGAALTDGLHFRTAPGAGQEALLSAFSEFDLQDGTTDPA